MLPAPCSLFGRTDNKHRRWKQALIGLAQAGIGEVAQGLGDELISGLAVRYLKSEGLTTFEEGADLLQALESLGL